MGPEPRDNLGVADLGFDLVGLKIQTKEVLTSIFSGLRAWSDDVKKKEILDDAEAEIISNNIRKLDRLAILLQGSNRDISSEIKEADAIKRQLGFLGASFS